MNIIFVSDKMARPKTLTFAHILLILAAVVLLTAMITASLIVPQSETKHQGVKSLLPSALHFSLHNPQEHINALAMQLGEMQARLMRLDALSERLSKMAGMKDKDIEALKQKPAQGGPQTAAYGLSENELTKAADRLGDDIQRNSDKLAMLESLLVQQSIKKITLPSTAPIEVGYNSSSYGYRVDPFTGKMAFHEGLDFTAEVGTPIYAAASGIVTTAELTPDYGKIIKIDHGSGYETRYAHTSAMLVKVGDRVEKGQLIAQVGNTGRSTGAHLHFEVRLNGTPLDPRKYLQN